MPKIPGDNINANETILQISFLFVKFRTIFLKVYKVNNAKTIFILPTYHLSIFLEKMNILYGETHNTLGDGHLLIDFPILYNN